MARLRGRGIVNGGGLPTSGAMGNSMSITDGVELMQAQPQQGEDAFNCLKRIALRRYSCRAFLPDPVPKEDIRRILEFAQRTPSWCNSQAWDVIVTIGTATDRIRDALLAHVHCSSEVRPDIPFPRGYVGRNRDRRRA